MTRSTPATRSSRLEARAPDYIEGCACGRRQSPKPVRSVIAALDHATLANGPGGPAEMVPGQHHVRMNMYIAQSHNGSFRIVKRLGAIDPKERVLAMS